MTIKQVTEAQKADIPIPKKIKYQNILYCICRTPYDDTKFYIQCESCNKWFHGNCVNITEQDGINIEHYFCPACLQLKN